MFAYGGSGDRRGRCDARCQLADGLEMTDTVRDAIGGQHSHIGEGVGGGRCDVELDKYDDRGRWH
jgi:hypothetical protein